MKIFEGILLISDIDGTLVKNDKSISKKNLEEIEYFKENGGSFAVITGRIPYGAKGVVETVKPNVPCGCLNGGGVYDFNQGKYLFKRNISDSVVELVDYIYKMMPSVGIELHTHEKIYFCKENPATEIHKKNENLPDLRCHYKNIKEPLAKVLFACNDENELPEIMSLLHSHPLSHNFDFIRSDNTFYEVLPKGMNKGVMLEKIAEIIGIDREKTIAVGDNDNDVSMLKQAHIGIAVANATENTKKAANYITVSNEEDAIAKVIHSIEKGMLKKSGTHKASLML